MLPGRISRNISGKAQVAGLPLWEAWAGWEEGAATQSLAARHLEAAPAQSPVRWANDLTIEFAVMCRAEAFDM